MYTIQTHAKDQILKEDIIQNPGIALEQIAKNTLLAMLYAYVISVSGFVLLWLVVGEQWLLLGWLVNILHLLLLGTLPAALTLGLLRRWRMLLAALPALIVCLIVYLPGFVPRTTAAAAASSTSLRVLTFNLARSTQPDVVELVRQSGADVVLLQELLPDAAAQFAALSAQYPYMALHPDQRNGYAGLGILSRYPITADAYRLIGLGQQRVTLDAGGMALAVFNMHTYPPMSLSLQAERNAQVAALLAWAAEERGAVLLGGDFNATPLTADYGLLAQRYTDAFAVVGGGFGFTYPSWGQRAGAASAVPPLARIDYVFVSADLQVRTAQVGNLSGSSDHRPLLVEVWLQNIA